MICQLCNKDKDESLFYSKYKKGKWCKKCIHTYQYERQKDKKRRAVELMGGCCQICKYNKCLAGLDFHHVDDNKELSPAKAARLSWNVYISEVKKCILLCCRCHREIHAGETSFDLSVEKDTNLHIKKTDISTGECPVCNCKLYGTMYCSSSCANIGRGLKSRRKIRPDRDILWSELRSMSIVQIAKKYKVSDNAIRKWAKSMNLPYELKTIKQYAHLPILSENYQQEQ